MAARTALRAWRRRRCCVEAAPQAQEASAVASAEATAGVMLCWMALALPCTRMAEWRL